jgi:hypothetical protein
MNDIMPMILYRIGVQSHRAVVLAEKLKQLGLNFINSTPSSYIFNDQTYNWVDMIFSYYPYKFGDIYTAVYGVTSQAITNPTGALSNDKQLAIVESIDTNTPMLLTMNEKIHIKNNIGRTGEFINFPAFNNPFESLPSPTLPPETGPYISVFEYGINRANWENATFKGRTSAILYLAPYSKGLTRGYLFADNSDLLLSLLAKDKLSPNMTVSPSIIHILFQLQQYSPMRYTKCVSEIRDHITTYGLMSADLLSSIILENDI